MTAVAIVYHSTGSRTRAIAEAVARGVAAEEGVTAQLLAVPDVDLEALLEVDAIIFGCLTYMGSATAPFKAFMDGTSEAWVTQAWADKLAAAFTCDTAGDSLSTLTQIAVFATQHGMVWIGAGETGAGEGGRLGVIAQPAARGEVDEDINAAEQLGRRVAAAARRWNRPEPGVDATNPMIQAFGEAERHPTTTTWQFPPSDRPPLPAPLERANLRELAARADRFEHHLVACATIGRAQLEVAAYSEPTSFGHINLSDEYSIALPCGDPAVDRAQMRTYIVDVETGTDVGRYNHRVGDLVLHPVGYLHWPGRLRPPYEHDDIPPGARRSGLALVFCASARTAGSAPALAAPADRAGDVKAYVEPAPPLLLAPVDGAPGTIARIGTTELTLVDRRGRIAPVRGGWVVVLEADASVPHFRGDLIRIPAGASLDSRGIRRALVLSAPDAPPDPPPQSWRELPPPPFAPYEDAARGALPFRHDELSIDAAMAGVVAVSLRGTTAAVPRYWLARMLFSAALHGLKIGYIETYGGLFIDDHGGIGHEIELGLRTPEGRTSIAIRRDVAIGVMEQIYRAVAPTAYRERLR